MTASRSDTKRFAANEVSAGRVLALTSFAANRGNATGDYFNSSPKKIPISRFALSGLSEPWTRFSVKLYA